MTSEAAAPRSLRLDERLCLALYNASRAMTARYRPLLDELGLTYPQYLVMLCLWEDGESTIGHLGDRLRLDSGTLSPLVRRLELAALVSRRRAPGDERSVIVSTTAAGAALRDRSSHVTGAVCDATGLSGEQQAELVGRLRKLVAELGRV